MITNESLIELHVKSKNKKEILRSLAGKAGELGRIRDVAGYMQSVLEREELFPTVIGYGIAIPHGKSNFVQKPFLAFASSPEPFRWDNRSELEARLIFLIGVPKGNATDLHLKILAKICRGLRNEYYWERLAQTTDASEVMAIFGKWGFRGEETNTPRPMGTPLKRGFGDLKDRRVSG